MSYQRYYQLLALCIASCLLTFLAWACGSDFYKTLKSTFHPADLLGLLVVLVIGTLLIAFAKLLGLAIFIVLAFFMWIGIFLGLFLGHPSDLFGYGIAICTTLVAVLGGAGKDEFFNEQWPWRKPED